MKKLILLTIALALLIGCEKEKPVIPEVTFTLNVSGFDLTTSEFGNLKSENAFVDFEHMYPTNQDVIFSNSTETYTFNTGDKSITDYEFLLPIGLYNLSINTNTNRHKDHIFSTFMLFSIDNINVAVRTDINEINISINPSCALLIICDTSQTLLTVMYLDDNSNSYTYVPGPIRLREYDLYYNYIDVSYLQPQEEDIDIPHYLALTKTDGTTISYDMASYLNGVIYKIDVLPIGTHDNPTLNVDSNWLEATTINW